MKRTISACKKLKLNTHSEQSSHDLLFDLLLYCSSFVAKFIMSGGDSIYVKCYCLNYKLEFCYYMWNDTHSTFIVGN